MVDYWTNFARTGNPNQGRQVPLEWPRLQRESDLSMGFQTPSCQVHSHFRANYSDFWDSIGYHWGW